ncbi:MAG TPA: tRNA (5-methylaminomethyl-2-thiouridine)(34)-methyltransferase MnmD [Cyclobacteriaceae bacterium]
MSIQIITTQDGSHSLFNTTLNETYHSVHGAVQESTHVFIKKGLDFLIERSNPSTINILEVGFGTGLNALLTLIHATTSTIKISYTTLETFPLGDDIWPWLNYSAVLGHKEYYEKLHQAPWNEPVNVLLNFELLKLNTKLEEVILPQGHFDIIFFDAFAPNKQPELWEYPILEKIARNLNNMGIFVTYCAKGQLKRDLKALGFTVETLPGPPGKKEMVRGTL